MEKILKAEGLTRAFENKGERFLAVRDVSFSLYRGEALGIVGESGSGKSTLVRMLTGLLAPTKGKIEFLSRDLTHAGSKEWRKCYREMQLVFQLPKESFDSGKTLGSGIGESLRNSGMKRKEVREKVAELLSTCGLTPDFAERYPGEVSGGECQRAAIARALAVEPSLLICDEATSALDVTVQKQVAEELLFMRKTYNTAMILVTHNIGVVRLMADRILVLQNGQAREYGETETVLDHPKDPYTKKLMSSVLHLKRNRNQEVQ